MRHIAVPRPKLVWILPIVATLLLSCGGGAEPETPPRVPERYALVIDAGSQGSRLHIYRWWHDPEEDLAEIHTAPWPREPGEDAWGTEVHAGLADYRGDAEGAAESLAPLVDYALERLPDAALEGDGPLVLLFGTAGFRRIPQSERDAIREAVSAYFEQRGLRIQRAQILTGEQEALLGWLGGNYLLGRLGEDAEARPVGGLDLGGASTQIAFVAEEAAGAHIFELELPGLDYDVYVRSDLGWGREVARETIEAPECSLGGFEGVDGTGAGDFDACKERLTETFRHCRTEPCPPRAEEVPALPGEFIAVSNYFYTSRFFQLDQPLSLAAMEVAGRAFCSLEWTEAQAEYPDVPPRYLGQYCFTTAYIVTLLTEGYGFPYDTRAISTIDRVHQEKAGWTLGAVLYELAGGSW